MIKLNKKAAANAGTFTTANKNLVDSITLSDKIKLLYRFIKLSKVCKSSIFNEINNLYNNQSQLNCLVTFQLK